MTTMQIYRSCYGGWEAVAWIDGEPYGAWGQTRAEAAERAEANWLRWWFGFYGEQIDQVPALPDPADPETWVAYHPGLMGV